MSADSRPDPAEVLAAIRDRLTGCPRARIVNTSEWNAITLDHALAAVDQVAADFGIESR